MNNNQPRELTLQQREIVSVVAGDWATNREISRMTRFSYDAVCEQTLELVRHGFLKVNDDPKAHLYRATSKGLKEIYELDE